MLKSTVESLNWITDQWNIYSRINCQPCTNIFFKLEGTTRLQWCCVKNVALPQYKHKLLHIFSMATCNHFQAMVIELHVKIKTTDADGVLPSLKSSVGHTPRVQENLSILTLQWLHNLGQKMAMLVFPQWGWHLHCGRAGWDAEMKTFLHVKVAG